MSLIPARNSRRLASVNIVPLVDVLVTLIFFFLVTMQFRKQSSIQTLNIVLPKIETAGDNRFVDQIEIAVSPEGQFFFNGQPLDENGLAAAVEAAARLQKEVPVLLLADEESLLKHITFIMDTCRRHGLEKIRLQSR